MTSCWEWRTSDGVKRVLVWVQHLLGSGHVERMRWVAEALLARGAKVTFVTGGVPLPERMPRGGAIVQLAPLRAADATFARLVDPMGNAVDDAYHARRAHTLLAAFDRAQPEVVVLETFPFGRRSLRRELTLLLERSAAAIPRPCVVTSVRDLLQRRADPARDREAWSVAQRHLDAILVHGDAAFARLGETLPPAADGTIPIVYTGFVRSPQPLPGKRARSEVVVAASGGDAGTALLRTALAARELSSLRGCAWRVLVGGGVAEAEFAALEALGKVSGAIVERHRDDFTALLAGARVAVTQAGYNTVLDVLATRTPSVLVPFAAAGETEQPMRASRLAALGRAEVVAERVLAPAVLAAAIDRAAAHRDMPPCPWPLDGAQRAAEAILTVRERAKAPS